MAFHSFPALRSSLENDVKKKWSSSLVVSMEEALNGTPLFLSDRQDVTVILVGQKNAIV